MPAAAEEAGQSVHSVQGSRGDPEGDEGLRPTNSASPDVVLLPMSGPADASESSAAGAAALAANTGSGGDSEVVAAAPVGGHEDATSEAVRHPSDSSAFAAAMEELGGFGRGNSSGGRMIVEKAARNAKKTDFNGERSVDADDDDSAGEGVSDDEADVGDSDYGIGDEADTSDVGDSDYGIGDEAE